MHDMNANTLEKCTFCVDRVPPTRWFDRISSLIIYAQAQHVICHTSESNKKTETWAKMIDIGDESIFNFSSTLRFFSDDPQNHRLIFDIASLIPSILVRKP